MSNDRQPLRQLLPAPTGGDGVGESGSATGSSAAAAEPSGQKRKNTASACNTCRLRKTKCDGAAPRCGACVRRDAECVYAEPDANKQLKVQFTRANELLAMHEELYERIQSRPEPETREMLDRIRTGQDVETVLRCWKGIG